MKSLKKNKKTNKKKEIKTLIKKIKEEFSAINISIVIFEKLILLMKNTLLA